ncbi:MAG: hypothetical protein Gyms2KO_30760 [Gymnodinialimonas sp.]
MAIWTVRVLLTIAVNNNRPNQAFQKILASLSSAGPSYAMSFVRDYDARMPASVMRAVATAALGSTKRNGKPEKWSNVRTVIDTTQFAYHAIGRGDDLRASSAVFETALVYDVERFSDNLHTAPVPTPVELDQAIDHYREDLIDLTKIDSVWVFWTNWYTRAMSGNPISWDLQEKVALLPNEVWEAGPESVADAIVQVEANQKTPDASRPENVPAIEKATFQELIKGLLSTPDVTYEFAVSSAETINRAIHEYLNATGENFLPDEFAAMEALPAHFRRIARLAEDSAESLNREQDLKLEIETLNGRVAQLEGELKVALEKTLDGRFKVAAIEGLAKTVTSPWAIGALGYATCHFFGWTPSAMTFTNLRSYGEALYKASPLIGR